MLMRRARAPLVMCLLHKARRPRRPRWAGSCGATRPSRPAAWPCAHAGRPPILPRGSEAAKRPQMPSAACGQSVRQRAGTCSIGVGPMSPWPRAGRALCTWRRAAHMRVCVRLVQREGKKGKRAEWCSGRAKRGSMACEQLANEHGDDRGRAAHTHHHNNVPPRYCENQAAASAPTSCASRESRQTVTWTGGAGGGASTSGTASSGWPGAVRRKSPAAASMLVTGGGRERGQFDRTERHVRVMSPARERERTRTGAGAPMRHMRGNCRCVTKPWVDARTTSQCRSYSKPCRPRVALFRAMPPHPLTG